MLMNDQRIVERFWTIFVGEGEERDHSAAGRLDYWKAGLRMIADHPLGGGGHGFSRAYGMPYIREVSGAEFAARSVHNGYINEVCEWGIQGGILRLAFLYTSMALMFETSRRCSRRGEVDTGPHGCGLHLRNRRLHDFECFRRLHRFRVGLLDGGAGSRLRPILRKQGAHCRSGSRRDAAKSRRTGLECCSPGRSLSPGPTAAATKAAAASQCRHHSFFQYRSSNLTHWAIRLKILDFVKKALS